MLLQRTCPAVLFLISLSASGCSNTPPRLVPPKVDPAAAGSGAIAEYDKNGNGMIDGAELDRAPALKSDLATIDTNSDKQISADEIQARIQSWIDSKLALTQLNCTVLLDGKPLEGAAVTFIPEKWLGPALHTATGVTDAQGNARPTMEDQYLPKTPNGATIKGGNCAFYRVEISKKSGDKETIPARYNTETTLGAEVAQGTRALMEGLHFDLKSK